MGRVGPAHWQLAQPREDQISKFRWNETNGFPPLSASSSRCFLPQPLLLPTLEKPFLLPFSPISHERERGIGELRWCCVWGMILSQLGRSSARAPLAAPPWLAGGRRWWSASLFSSSPSRPPPWWPRPTSLTVSQVFSAIFFRLFIRFPLFQSMMFRDGFLTVCLLYFSCCSERDVWEHEQTVWIVGLESERRWSVWWWRRVERDRMQRFICHRDVIHCSTFFPLGFLICFFFFL